MAESMSPGAHRKGGCGRAEQSGGRERSDFPCSKPKREQVSGQKNRDEAIGESSERPGAQQREGGRVGASRKQRATNHCRPILGV